MVVGTLLAGIGLVVGTVQQTYSIPIGVSLRFGWLSTLDLLRQAAFVAVVVVLLLADAGLLPFLAATIPASLIVLAVAIPLVRGTAPLLPRFERSEWLRILRLVGVYAAAAAVGTIYVSAVIVTTSLVGTAEESGLLGAAFRIFTVLAGIPLLLVSTAFPVLRVPRTPTASGSSTASSAWSTSRSSSEAGWRWRRSSAPMCAIDIVAGAEFEDAVPVLQIQGLALLAGFLAVTGAFALVSLRRHTALLVGNLVGLAASIVLTARARPGLRRRGRGVRHARRRVGNRRALRNRPLREPGRALRPRSRAPGGARRRHWPSRSS